MEDKLNHFDDQGRAWMVDVDAKEATPRLAVAAGEVQMRPQTLRRILDRSLEKGDVLQTARLAGIMAAKKTSDLIPLCHPLQLSAVAIEFTPYPENNRIAIEARVKLTGRTGVEMEALTAVSVAALTIYDMCKAIDREIEIGRIRLLEKRGGKSGSFVRKDQS